MAGDQKGTIRAATDGGVSGEHPSVEPFQFLVGPTTTDQFNTARLRLIPIACWRVDDVRFAFDSSFVNADPDPDNPNDIRAELGHLLDLVNDHPGAPLSVFGHADPVGSDDYNKLLSGRRAMAIYAVLVAHGEPDRAVKLWDYVSRQEHWAAKQREAMQTFTGLPSGTPDSTLYRSYLQKLCPPELKLTKKDFLGQGADSGSKGDFQGCSEFNPLLLFSKEKQDRFDKAQQRNSKDDVATLEERNAANAPNRRVMALLFRRGSRVDPAKWPCPRALEGVAGCKKRFFSDGEKRRSTRLSTDDRKFDDKEDTFACRFYQRISSGSPCRKLTANVFRYGLELAKHLPWTEAATFRIVATDGSQERSFSMDEGAPTGNLREFIFSEARPGVLYKGEVVEGDLRLDLFAPVELFRVQDPGDRTNNLPLPLPNAPVLAEPAGKAPPPAPKPPPPPGVETDIFDFDVEEEALPNDRVDTVF